MATHSNALKQHLSMWSVYVTRSDPLAQRARPSRSRPFIYRVKTPLERMSSYDSFTNGFIGDQE